MIHSIFRSTHESSSICATQPPDPKRTMLLLEELYLELKIRPLIEFVFNDFTETVLNCNGSSYVHLKESTLDMLETIVLFLKYPELADYREDYDCKSPIPLKILEIGQWA